jgi:modulator of FtsH protease HflK
MKRIVTIITTLLLLAYLATGVYQVRPGERAVVRRFGRVDGDPRLPGLHLGLPWGLDRVDCVAVDAQRQLTVGFEDVEDRPRDSAPAGQLLTGDNNLANIRATVHYHVDAERVVEYVLNDERIERILPRATEEVLAATLAEQRIDPVLFGQARGLEPQLQERLTERLRRHRLGVLIDSVNLVHVQPPAEVAEAFRDVNRARTQKENARTEAERLREMELSTARNDARRLHTEGVAAARDRVTRAGADAQNFRILWDQYRNQPGDSQAVLLNLYLREMQAVLARMQVRTVSDQNVEQIIVLPGGDK